MMLPLLALFPVAALAQTDGGAEGGPATIAATAEYGSFCRTCPYNICAHTAAPAEGHTYQVNCWTKLSFSFSHSEGRGFHQDSTMSRSFGG